MDGLDAPLGESAERYRVKLEGAGGSMVLEVRAAEATIPNSQLASLGTGPINLFVVQVGDYAASRPATAVFN